MNDLFYLTDEQRMIRDLARKLARERIAPHAAHYDETETYPEESMKAIVEAGLYAVGVLVTLALLSLSQGDRGDVSSAQVMAGQLMDARWTSTNVGAAFFAVYMAIILPWLTWLGI